MDDMGFSDQHRRATSRAVTVVAHSTGILAARVLRELL
jgi:hypothetical protein